MKAKPLPWMALALGTALLAATVWAGGEAPPAKAAAMRRGRQLYRQVCFTCHQVDGQGVAGVYPPLARSDLLLNQRSRAIAVLLRGRQGPIVVNGRTYNNVMPNLNLSDGQIADVLTYVTNNWGAAGALVAAKQVTRQRALLARNPDSQPLAPSAAPSGMMGMMGSGMSLMGGGMAAHR